MESFGMENHTPERFRCQETDTSPDFLRSRRQLVCPHQFTVIAHDNDSDRRVMPAH